MGSKGQLDWEATAKHARTLDVAALEYVISDCRAAAKAQADMPNGNSGYYLDEASVYAKELQARSKATGKQTAIERIDSIAVELGLQMTSAERAKLNELVALAKKGVVR